jgi:uncharacterized protein YbjT (DUF2867 family)
VQIAVIGATGGVGRETVRRALDAGHRVRACARHPEALAIRHADLEIRGVDATRTGQLEPVLAGVHAVICTLGAPASDKEKIRTRGTQNLVHAMEALNVKRLVCLSSLGFGDSRPLLPPLMRYIVVPVFLATAFADHAGQEEAVRTSNLEWTLVRPGSMDNGAFTGRYRYGFPFDDRSVRIKPVARADVADFLVRQLTAADHVRKTVGICGE